MAKKVDKNAERVNRIYQHSKTDSRVQWEYINQKGYDFANDNQLTYDEKVALEEQGMPTFTINRIIPVVEMLNYYATASNPRCQAVGVEGSDSDVATVYSDIADYIWNNSAGDTLLSNAINDAVTKSLGYLLVTVDPDADRGMGEVIIQQPDPFDVFIDNKSRDILFRDAAYVLIRKILPKGHLIQQFPDSKRKIMAASSNTESYENYSEKAADIEQHEFQYKEMNSNNSIYSEKENELVEFFEMYEKEKIPYVNVFYKVPPDKKVIANIKKQAAKQTEDMRAEMMVAMKEKQVQMLEAVKQGKMLEERMQLELKKEMEMMENQLKSFAIEVENKLQEERIKKTYPNDWKIHLASRTHNSEIEIDSISENLFDIIIKAENNNQPKKELNQYLYNLYLEEWCMNTL